MSQRASFAGVILAAGDSSRMGTDKALLPWPPRLNAQNLSSDTFLSAAIKSLLPSADFVLVVAGRNEATLAAVAYINGASIVVNPDPSRGQFSSLQVGLREVLNRGRDAAIVTLVDRPPASAATVRKLREGFEAAPENIWGLVPEFSGKHGHPFIAGRDLIERFLREPVTGNAREVEHRHQEHLRYLAVDDPYVALNINTPKDYAGLATK
ncbi:MAG TPA: nucleotidyltransferase family protein [Dongiaceae bacterium]|nr:nucleotidyltransferase family protein [Dongiaceae bacterium]